MLTTTYLLLIDIAFLVLIMALVLLRLRSRLVFGTLIFLLLLVGLFKYGFLSNILMSDGRKIAINNETNGPVKVYLISESGWKSKVEKIAKVDLRSQSEVKVDAEKNGPLFDRVVVLSANRYHDLDFDAKQPNQLTINRTSFKQEGLSSHVNSLVRSANMNRLEGITSSLLTPLMIFFLLVLFFQNKKKSNKE